MVLRGPIDSSNLLRPNYADNRLEVVKFDNRKAQTAPLIFTGLSYSTNQTVEDNCPDDLYEGNVLCLKDYTDIAGRYTAAQQAVLGIGTTRGSKFYDFSADGSLPSYVVFNNGHTIITGMKNRFHTYTTGTPSATPDFVPAAPPDPAYFPVDASWDPGVFGSNAVTVLSGNLKLWVGVPLLANDPTDVANHAIGDDVVVVNGRFKIVTTLTGLKGYGKVENIYTNGTFRKFLLNVDMANPNQY